MVEIKLTPGRLRVLSAIKDGAARSANRVAIEAKVGTQSPAETAARYLIALTKMGLTSKEGTRMFPKWRITDAGRTLLTSEAPHG
jgi:hypothetical protein